MRLKRIIKPIHYKNRPWWFNGLNRVWERSYPLGTHIELNKDDLIKKARDKTGLQDLGKDFWDEPLERLIRSINEEARLNPAGRFINRTRFLNLLSNRLRAEEFFKKHPEILDQPLYPMFIITGLQRTGTTKLHRLLNADPANRVVKSWEAINPAPTNKQWRQKDKRIKEARISERALRLMAPGFFAIHPVEYLAPEEDVLLLDISFLSTTPEATMNVPSYSSWLQKTDQTPAYLYACKLLKFLQWQKPARRWILKSPHHLEFLDIIKKIFGNVHIIWTHRDPKQSIPSFLSMVSHSRAIFSDHVTLHDVAKHWVNKSEYMLSRGIRFRKTNRNDALFSDIHYDNFIENPMEDLANLYRLNGSLTADLKVLFEKANKENPQGKYGIHQYELADFGLTEEEINEKTKIYTDYFSRYYEKQ